MVVLSLSVVVKETSRWDDRVVTFNLDNSFDHFIQFVEIIGKETECGEQHQGW